MSRSKTRSKNKKRRKQFLEAFRVAFSYARKYKKELIFVAALSILNSLILVSIPFFTGKFFDSLIDLSKVKIFGQEFSGGLVFFIIMVLLAVILNFVGHFRSTINRTLGAYLDRDYHVSVFQKLFNLPISFYKKHNSSKIINAIGEGASAVENIVSNVYTRLGGAVLTIIFAAIMGFTVNYVMTFTLLFGAVVYIFVLLKSIPKSTELQLKSRDAWNSTFQIIGDTMENIQTVKESAAEKPTIEKLEKNIKNAASKYLLPQLFQVKIRTLNWSITDITRYLVIGVGLLLFAKGEISIGEIIMFTSFVSFIFNPLQMLSEMWRWLESGIIKLEYIEGLLKTKPEKYEQKNHNDFNVRGEIEFKNVEFWYEKKDPVLNKINISIKPGETIALVGESGEGKSTFIQLMSGYYYAQKGEVLIDGINVKKLGLGNLRKHIAVVPQDLSLFNDTITNNIRFGAFDSTDEEVQEAAEKAYATSFIKKFPKKWKQMVGTRGVKLSGGQRQRVAIARAFLRNPSILILDEPTSALDAKAEHEIQKSLETLMEGRTTFIIAHRLSTVRHADRILVFKGGKIVEEGKHENLIKKKKGVYRELHELQIGLHE